MDSVPKAKIGRAPRYCCYACLIALTTIVALWIVSARVLLSADYSSRSADFHAGLRILPGSLAYSSGTMAEFQSQVGFKFQDHRYWDSQMELITPARVLTGTIAYQMLRPKHSSGSYFMVEIPIWVFATGFLLGFGGLLLLRPSSPGPTQNKLAEQGVVGERV